MGRGTYQRLLVALCFMGLVGCGSLLPSPGPERTVLHDFGPAPTYHARGEQAVTAWVESVPWLGGTNIQYRLLYRDPTAVHAYADNVWVAPPSELLAARLRARLADETLPVTARRYRLTVTILSFSQEFRAPGDAFARIELSAQLTDLRNDHTLGRRLINMTRPCRPDVAGAVAGLSRVAIAAADDLAAFASTQLKGPNRGP